jgi:TldD protein
MHKRSTAHAEGANPTGNGRAFSVRHPPIVRMRNTYFEAADHTLEEAIELLGDGVYLMDGRGGAPASDGTFTFTAARGYKVEDGEIVEPTRSTTISGHVLDFLDGSEALTENVEVTTTNFGGCGK